MKRVKPLVILLALSINVSAVALPVSGSDISKFLPSNGNIVNINQRQTQIERRIKDAIGAGRLTRAESETFLDDLQKITDMESAFRASSGGLSTWESLKLVFQLDALSRRFEQSLRDRTVSSTDLDQRLSEIQWRLDDARSSKRLTDQEVTEFSYEINRIKLQKESFGGDGVITDAESLKLSLALDTLSSRMEATMHDRQYQLPNIDKFEAELNHRIREGIESKKIDSKEADELKQEFRRITQREAKIKRFGRPLTSVESLELALDLEKLSESIDKFSTTTTAASPDYVRKKARLQDRVARSLMSGKLTLAESYQLNEQLDELTKQETDLSKTDGNLSGPEQKLLVVELEKITSSLDRRLADTSKSWPGINEKLDSLNKRITAARSKDRLTEAEAVGLNDELKTISKKWSDYQNTDEDAALPLDETLAVTSSIERLNQKLSESMHDRSVEIPKLEALRNGVDNRITTGILGGRLTLGDGKKYLDEFDNIVTNLTAQQAEGATFTDRDRLMIALEFQQLRAKVERSIKDTATGTSTTELKTQIGNQIISGHASGKLTESEMKSLSTECARVKALETPTAGGKLSGREALAFLQALRSLQISVRHELQDSEIASNDLDQRISEIQVRIATGVTTGKLTAKDADELRKELARIQDLERDYGADGGISRGESVTLAYLLETLGARIESSMTETHVLLPNLTRMQEDIDRKLASAVVDGFISLKEVDQYTTKLEDISRSELSFRYSGDGLSFPESSTLMGELEKLSAAIDATLSSGTHSWPGLDKSIEKSSQKIADGIASKKIPADSGSALKTELDRIQKAKVAFAHSQGGYDLEETESMVRDLDRLNAEVDMRLKGQNFAWSDIDRRQQNVEQLIRAAIKSGKLNSSEAKEVQAELDRIKRAKAAFTISDGDLNYFERVSLASALDKLDDMMKKKTR